MAAPKGIDWKQAEKQYVTGNMSQEALAGIIGANPWVVHKRATAEKWVQKRKEYREEVAKKSIEKAAEAAVKEGNKIFSITDKLIDKIAQSVEVIEPGDWQSFRALTIALKDIKDLRGEKSKLDVEEQMARIAKLRHDVEITKANAETAKLEVVGLPEEFKK